MNKIKFLVAPLLALPFVISCGGGSTEYKVSIPDTNGVTVRPGQAYKGKDYVGTIAMAQDVDPDHVLPAALDKVTSGNKELQPKDYTYTLKEDKLSADFKIPAANIVGDVSIQLTLVDKPDPVIKHKLTFTGTNCGLYLDAEGKTEYKETDFEASYIFSGYIIPTEGYALPKEVTFTSGGQPYESETATYNVETGALSVKMSADIDVTAVSEVFGPYQVTEAEFNNALSFKDEQYLQISSETNTGFEDPMIIAAKASPTVFYSLADTPMPAPIPSFYSESFIAKNQDGSYDKYERESKEGDYTKTAGTAEEFKTPQQMNLLEQLKAAGVSYKSFTYDENTKGYTATYTAPSATEATTTTLKFENKKLVSEVDVVSSTSTTSTSLFTYKEETPKLPYEITFKNYDDTELQKSFVAEGETPVYHGSTPTKIVDGSFYIFKDWDKTIVAATEDTTYTATYNTTTYVLCASFTVDTSKNKSVSFTLESGKTLNIVDWGDGTTDTSTSHTYTDTNKVYNVNVSSNSTTFKLSGSGVTSITHSNLITSIGSNDLYNLYNLETLNVSDNVKSVAWDIFGDDRSYIPDSVINYDPDEPNLLYLGNESNPYVVLFWDGTDYGEGEESYTINSNCKVIAVGSLNMNDNLTSIEIPNSVVSINDSAFSDDTALKTVDLSNVDHLITGGSNMFDGCPLEKIIVKSNLVDTYKADPIWSAYKAKIVTE